MKICKHCKHYNACKIYDMLNNPNCRFYEFDNTNSKTWICNICGFVSKEENNDVCYRCGGKLEEK